MDKSLGTFFQFTLALTLTLTPNPNPRLTLPPTPTNNIERVYPQFFFRVLKFYRVGEGEL